MCKVLPVTTPSSGSNFKHRGELVYLPPVYFSSNPPPELPPRQLSRKTRELPLLAKSAQPMKPLSSVTMNAIAPPLSAITNSEDIQ